MNTDTIIKVLAGLLLSLATATIFYFRDGKAKAEAKIELLMARELEGHVAKALNEYDANHIGHLERKKTDLEKRLETCQKKNTTLAVENATLTERLASGTS